MRAVYTPFLILFGFGGFLMAQPSSQGVQVLMLDACTYDPYYSEQITATFSQISSDIAVTSFNDEPGSSIDPALEGKDICMIAYPHKGSATKLGTWGASLRRFAQSGGLVVFTGTHEISKINLFNLLSLERGSYNPNPQVQTLRRVLFTKSLPNQFTSSNFTYPVVTADEAYVSLAQDNDRSVYGYTKLGKGLVFYVGLEFYHIEAVNRAVLDNLIAFVRIQKSDKAPANTTAKQPTESRELEQLASRVNTAIEWNVFPNPYVTHTKAEFIVSQTTKVEATIFNVQGQLVTRPILPTQYEPGRHAIDIPDLPYGTFFIQLRIGDQRAIKKIMRIPAP